MCKKSNACRYAQWRYLFVMVYNTDLVVGSCSKLAFTKKESSTKVNAGRLGDCFIRVSLQN